MSTVAAVRARVKGDDGVAMTLGPIVVIFTSLALIMASALRAFAVRHLRDRDGWVTNQMSIIIIFVSIMLMSARSPVFGMDTIQYLNFFRTYCAINFIDSEDQTYLHALAFLNLVMFGACDAKLLPVTWLFVVATVPLLVNAKLDTKICYLAVFFTSMIGVELSVDAMRQGLSVGFTVIAVSNWGKSRPVMLIAALAAIAFHTSALLVGLAVLLARLSWRFMIVAILLLVAVIGFVLQSDSAQWALISNTFVWLFLRKLQLALLLDSDEFPIRVLSAMTIVTALIAPAVAGLYTGELKAILRSENYQWAAKLSLFCVPFLSAPYFGFRFAFGVFPIVLWLVIDAASRSKQSRGIFFTSQLLMNAAILALWGFGSAAMRATEFF